MRLLFAIILTLNFNFSYADECVEFKTVSGLFIQESGCVETGYALLTEDSAVVCIGFHSDDLTEEDLILGVFYSLGGYETEDGFFVTEFSD